MIHVLSRNSSNEFVVSITSSKTYRIKHGVHFVNYVSHESHQRLSGFNSFASQSLKAARNQLNAPTDFQREAVLSKGVLVSRDLMHNCDRWSLRWYRTVVVKG